MSKRILMIAYHYPPCRGSSGLQRPLNFTRHLPNHGWEPLLLTIHPGNDPACSDDQVDDIPAAMLNKRAFALQSGVYRYSASPMQFLLHSAPSKLPGRGLPDGVR